MENNVENLEKKDNKKILYLIGLIVGSIGLVIAAILLIMAIFSNDDNKDPTKGEEEEHENILDSAEDPIKYYTIIENNNKYLLEYKDNKYEILIKFPSRNSVFFGKYNNRLYYNNYEKIMYYSLDDKKEYEWVDAGDPSDCDTDSCYKYFYVTYGKIIDGILYYENFDGPFGSINDDEDGYYKHQVKMLSLDATSFDEAEGLAKVYPDYWTISNSGKEIYYAYGTIHEYNVETKEIRDLELQDGAYKTTYLSATTYKNGKIFYLKCIDQQEEKCEFEYGSQYEEENNYDYELRMYDVYTEEDTLIYTSFQDTESNLKKHYIVTNDDDVYYISNDFKKLYHYDIEDDESILYYDLSNLNDIYDITFNKNGVIKVDFDETVTTDDKYIYNGLLLTREDSKLEISVKIFDGTTKKYSLIDLNDIVRWNLHQTISE